MRYVFLIFLFPLKLFSQDLEGVWTGTLYNDTTHKFLPYEIAISENKGKLSGFSHTVFLGENNLRETGIKSLKIKKKDNKILVEDEELVFNDYREPAPKGVRQYSVLEVKQSDTGLILVGVFNTNRTREYSSLTGSISLKKKEKVTESRLVPKLDELKKSGDLSFLQAHRQDKEPVAVTTPAVSKETASNRKPADDKKANTSAGKENLLMEISEDKVDYNVDVVAKENKQKENTSENKEPDLKRSVVSTGNARESSGPITTKAISKATVVEQKDIMSDLKKVKGESMRIATRQVVINQPVKKREIRVPDRPLVLPVIKTVDDQQKNNGGVAENHPIKIPERKLPPVNQALLQNTSPAKQETKVTPSQEKNPVLNPPVLQQKNPVVSQEINKPATNKGNIVTPPSAQSEETAMAPAISASDIAKRKIETIRSVDIRSDSIVLTLYDNGVIDGDTVSVIMNGQVIMSRQMLTEKANTKTIHMRPEMGDSLQLIMYAENLGTIAPNTGLLIIRDGEESYQIRFSGDLQKNSAIILRRKH